MCLKPSEKGIVRLRLCTPSEQSRQLLFEGFQILHANVCTNACKSCIREHSRGVHGHAGPWHSGCSLCLERELLPDTAHLFPSQKKQVRSRDKHPLVGDKGCLPSSFFVQEEF